MANVIYLIIDEKRDCAMVKVGFTANPQQRMALYTTHNPGARCIGTAKTYAKTGRTVEHSFHEELKARGYNRAISPIDGKRTEWYIVPYTDTFYGELLAKGLRAFKCGKYRKDCGGIGK
jgi:hypothetical protein